MIRCLLLLVMLVGCAVKTSAPKPAAPEPQPEKTLAIGQIVGPVFYYQDSDGKQVCMDVVGFGFFQFTGTQKNCLCITQVHKAPGKQYLQQRVILAHPSVCQPPSARSDKKSSFQL